jgi:hypothetical protein
MVSLRHFVHALLAPLRGILPALGWVVSRPAAALQWLRQLRVELWSVEGKEQNSGLPLTILCAVRGVDRNYVLNLIFGGAYRERRLGRFWLWNLAKAIAAVPDCSLIVVDACESHLRLARPADWFLLPAWVLGTVALPRDAAATHKVSGDLRRIRRHALQGEISHDPQQFDDFYHNMHVPYVANTFGDCAAIAPYERLMAEFEHGLLLLIKNQERTIAGQVILHLPAGPCFRDMGIRDGNRDYVKDGAACALYHFGLQHLQDGGYTSASFGWSRPFLRDGVLQFKKKWSQRLVGGYPNGFALRVLSHTPAARAFLCNNPFIFRRGGQFYAAVFVDGGKPLSAEDVRQIDKDYFHPGLARLVIYCPGQGNAPPADAIPAELSERIMVRSDVAEHG